jgi:hypothetical protein
VILSPKLSSPKVKVKAPAELLGRLKLDGDDIQFPFAPGVKSWLDERGLTTRALGKKWAFEIELFEQTFDVHFKDPLDATLFKLTWC